MSEHPNPIPATTIIAGAQPTTVTHHDGRGEDKQVTYIHGQVETVNVRLVPLTQLKEYHDKVADIHEFVAFLCKKDRAWAESLDDDSLFAIDELGKALNVPRWGRLLNRQKATFDALRPTKKASEDAAASMNSLQTPSPAA